MTKITTSLLSEEFFDKALGLFNAQDALVEDPFYKMHRTKLKALQSERRVRVFCRGSELLAVCVLFKTKNVEKIHSYGREIITKLGVGSWKIKRFALATDCATQGLSEVVENHYKAGTALILEVPITDTEGSKLARLLSLKRVTTKVTAFADLIGVYTSQPVEKMTTVGHIAESVTGLKLNNMFGMVNGKYDVSGLRRKILETMPQWSNHYSNYNDGKAWAALCLVGYGGTEEFIIKPLAMSRKWKRDNAEKLHWKVSNTPLMDIFGTYVEPLLTSIPGPKERVRFMRLTPNGGTLSRHTDKTDKNLGIKIGHLVRLHIPIITNPDVGFTSWGLNGKPNLIRMREGELWYLDIKKPHMAVNKGDEARIHLVIDVVMSHGLLNKFHGSFYEGPKAGRNSIGREMLRK